MTKHGSFLFFLLTVYLSGFSQRNKLNDRYLEDQLYLGITYNSLLNKPIGTELKGFSNGLALGYIKDIPVNKQRNFGFGIGLGYGRNTYYQNIRIYKVNGQTVFESLFGESFDKNKFSFHSIDMPIEVRWRTSTAAKYKFWRVYSGVKMSYVFASNAVYKKVDDKSRITNFNEVNKFQYGITLSLGYGTWNFNVYYGLSNLFKNAVNSIDVSKMNDLRFGLIFYIL